MSSARECGVCWYLYDPAVGDDVWQVEPGTPFEALPAHWRCPRCDSGKDRFLPPKEEPVATALEHLVATYEAACERMKELPVFNPALHVEAVGFHEFHGNLLGVVITPWFMNLVLLPGPGAAALPREGETRGHVLPAGTVDFVGARLDGVGPFESCSLFSPMPNFESAAAARATAEEALQLLVAPPVPTPSRRQLFSQLLPAR
jgi:[NiFe] hydrogenase assembly HybE family chaperone